MFDDGKKKRLYIIGGVVGLLLIAVLIVVVINSKGKKGEELLGVDINNGVGSSGTNIGMGSGYNGSLGSIGSVAELDKPVDVIIPSKKIEGKVDKYELSGNYGKLELVNGESKDIVELKIGGIIFDTAQNKAIFPSDIKKGSSLSVYTYSDLEESKLDIDLAEVVIVSPKDNMGYVPIEGLKTDGKKIEFKSKDKEYEIKGTLYSALSGKEYDERQLSELEDGDRVIYYGVEKEDKVIIEKAYVYPAFK